MLSQSTGCQNLNRIIMQPHVRYRIHQRGGNVADVEALVHRAHRFVQERSFLLGLPLALRGGDVVPIVEFRQHGSRAVVATALTPGQCLKPGTVPLEV